MTPVDRPIIILGVFLMLSAWVHPVFVVGVFVMFLDICARWKDYLHIRRYHYRVGIAYNMRGSWCSRGVVEFVWPNGGSRLYRSMGYRWYHILPDGAPGCFLRLAFWRHVVGIYR